MALSDWELKKSDDDMNREAEEFVKKLLEAGHTHLANLIREDEQILSPAEAFIPTTQFKMSDYPITLTSLDANPFLSSMSTYFDPSLILPLCDPDPSDGSTFEDTLIDVEKLYTQENIVTTLCKIEDTLETLFCMHIPVWDMMSSNLYTDAQKARNRRVHTAITFLFRLSEIAEDFINENSIVFDVENDNPHLTLKVKSGG